MESKVVFTNGCFDLLHAGHLDVLTFARKHAGHDGYVIVGLNSDNSVRRLKGLNRPVLHEEFRAMMLRALDRFYVDQVIIFDEDTPYELIKEEKPDVIVKGPGYKPEDVIGVDLVGVENIHICPDNTRLSTTNLIHKIKSLK